MRYHQEDHPNYPNTVFVFGSNLAGRHGRGAAKYARDRLGAIRGQGLGFVAHLAYAIPTKDVLLYPLPLPEIDKYVYGFLQVAACLDREFFVTRVGCGLAGFKDETIAPLFSGITSNCIMPSEWAQYLE